MDDNIHLKRGLIVQSLSPLLFLLIVRHFHLDYPYLIGRFICGVNVNRGETVMRAITHPRCGELLVVVIGALWSAYSILSISSFEAVQDAGFESRGEMIVVAEERRDAAATFLMTFVMPLLIDDLSTPQYWVSYLLVIVVVYAVLSHSNLYYQSPLLALLGYRVFTFRVLDPAYGLEGDREYVGITKRHAISEEAAIMWKHIADDVFLVYNEGAGRR